MATGVAVGKFPPGDLEEGSVEGAGDGETGSEGGVAVGIAGEAAGVLVCTAAGLGVTPWRPELEQAADCTNMARQMSKRMFFTSILNSDTNL